MKARVFVSLAALLLVFVVVASAADPTGTWKAQVPGRDGNTREMTIVLKAEGAKLTGTISGRGGDQPISDGKVDGDNISFAVVMNFGGNEVKILYTGKVAGDEIKFTSQREGSDQKREFTAKKG